MIRKESGGHMARWAICWGVVAACGGGGSGDEDTDTDLCYSAWVDAVIDESRHCSEAADCVDAGSQCPFGCYVIVNANEVDRVRDAFGQYAAACNEKGSICEYDCGPLGGIDCVEDLCVGLE